MIINECVINHKQFCILPLTVHFASLCYHTHWSTDIILKRNSSFHTIRLTLVDVTNSVIHRLKKLPWVCSMTEFLFNNYPLFFIVDIGFASRPANFFTLIRRRMSLSVLIIIEFCYECTYSRMVAFHPGLYFGMITLCPVICWVTYFMYREFFRWYLIRPAFFWNTS